MHRRRFLRDVAKSFLFLGLTGCRTETGEKPNIVLIVVDDLGWRDLGCYGSRYYETPNIDRLREQGMKFTNAYAACAVCSPTRAAIMTGRYPVRTGITDWIHHFDPRIREAIRTGIHPEGYDPGRNRPLLTPLNHFWLEHDEITLAEALKSRGYVSCHVGKWHLGPRGWYPETQGFDTNFGGCEFGQPPGYFDPYANSRYKGIPTLPPRKKGEYLTYRECDEAVNFIQKHQNQPFFLYLAHYAVHAPLQAPRDLIIKYEDKEKTNQRVPVYAAMVEAVDRSVGRIVAILKQLRLFHKTLIIFTSDNGGASHFPATDNFPLRKGKGFPYEGGLRIPLIVRWPGVVKPGSISDVPVISMDLFPTICEATGAEIPGDRPIDGISLTPVFGQSTPLPSRALFWHFPHYWWGTHVQPYSIIREGDWKLIHHYQSEKDELYNLKKDPGENHDLIDVVPEKAIELEKKLNTWLRQTGAKLPKKNPKYQLFQKTN